MKNLDSTQVIRKTPTHIEPIELPALSTSKPSVFSFESTIELKTFHATAKWFHGATDTVDSIKVKGRLIMLLMCLDTLNSKSTMLSRNILEGLPSFLSKILPSSRPELQSVTH